MEQMYLLCDNRCGIYYTFCVCVFGNIILNIATAMIMHYACFRLCYHINRKNAVFQSTLLVAINGAAEYLIIFIPYIDIPNDTLLIVPTQSFMLTLVCKLLYLIGIMIISRLFCDNKQSVQPASISLLAIPVLTVIIVILMLNIHTTSNLMSVVCLILIIINIIVFATNQKMIVTETEKNAVEQQKLKEKIDYDEYVMLKETQQQTAIFNHDFKAHIDALSSLIGADNIAAQEYIQSISDGINTSRFVEYSDNKILNFLLSKKKEECQSKGIQFLIDPIQAHLQFLSDKDTVSIFSNLINNAMENCLDSRDKMIYLNIHMENENFVVIKIENTSDTKPIVINGKLTTHKDNLKLHGIGMNSITRALTEYNGSVAWEYNEHEKVFSTRIIIKNFTV